MASSGYGTFLDEKVRTEFALNRRERRTSSLSTADWMAKVDDESPVSSLSLPGTHDSSAFTSSWPFVSTQKMDILQQLDAGIRYFDLRCGLVKDIVEMVHGRALLGLRLDAVLDTMYKWLDVHQTEGLVVQIKQDRREEDSEMSFHSAIYNILDISPKYWRTLPTTPKLKELRGKIQLFRRFPGPPFRGIDVSRWQDNPTTPFTIRTYHGVLITIQDHYSPTDPVPLPDFVDKKGGDVSFMLNKAVTDTSPDRWYINFVSAFEINFYYQVSPREVALGGWWNFQWITGLNPRLAVYLKEHATRKRKQRYGIIAMDFPEQGSDDLIKSVIRSNFADKKTSLLHPITWVIILLVLIYVAGLVLLFVHGRVERPWCPPWLHACALQGDAGDLTQLSASS